MQIIIYARKSTNVIGGNESLNVQSDICHAYVESIGKHVKQEYREISSAFTRMPPVLRTICKRSSNSKIIFSCIDRFSRNTTNAMKYGRLAIARGNHLVFVRENIICRTTRDLNLIRPFLQAAQLESSRLGDRLRQARRYKIANGIHPGGRTPYGYTRYLNTISRNCFEQTIIRFIKSCKTNPNINSVMRYLAIILNDDDLEWIDLCEHGEKVYTLAEPMTDRLIAYILNDYSITKRGIRWTSAHIKAILKANPITELNLDELNNSLNEIM